MRAPTRGDLEWRLEQQLGRFAVRLHVKATAAAPGPARRYAVFEGSTVHGEPTSHAAAQALRQRMTIAAILEAFADAGVPIPGELP